MLLCYECHRYNDEKDFRPTLGDPLAQVCNTCKKPSNDAITHRPEETDETETLNYPENEQLHGE